MLQQPHLPLPLDPSNMPNTMSSTVVATILQSHSLASNINVIRTSPTLFRSLGVVVVSTMQEGVGSRTLTRSSPLPVVATGERVVGTSVTMVARVVVVGAITVVASSNH